MGLRERLTEACLASERFIAEDGYPSFGINSNAEAAEKALLVVVAWLRAEEIGDLFAEATERHAIVDGQTDAMGNSPCLCGKWWDTDQGSGWDQHMAYVGLRALADSITGSTDGH